MCSGAPLPVASTGGAGLEGEPLEGREGWPPLEAPAGGVPGAPVRLSPGGFLETAATWATGRRWEWRAALLLLLAWDAGRHLRDPAASGLFGGITFGAHELGHLVFGFLGEFMGAAGGSLAQVLVPAGAGLLLYRHRDYFGLALCGSWLASSLLDLARYIADARQAELDLVSFGEGAVHDWSYLLGRLGLLGQDLRIAALTRGLGILVLAASLLFGTWLCLRMARSRPRGP